MILEDEPVSVTSTIAGDVLVAEFQEAKMLDEAVINEVGEELMKMVGQCTGNKMLLDFSNITFMSSSMIGKIVFLDNDCKSKGVDLKLCSINANVMEVFSLMNLDKILSIYDDRDQAIAAF